MKERNYGNFAEKELLGSARSADVTLYLSDALQAEKKKTKRLERKIEKLERQVRQCQAALEGYEVRSYLYSI